MLRRINIKNVLLIGISSLMAIVLITSAFLANSRPVHAQYNPLNNPFGGKISDLDICCNGEEWDQGNTGGVSGEMLIDWATLAMATENATIMDNYTSLGSAITGGICLDITEECESGDNVDYSIVGLLGNQIGTAPNAGGGSN